MAGSVLVLIGVAAASAARAQEAAADDKKGGEVKAEVALTDAVEPEKKDGYKAPWRGSSFTYRNAVTALSFKKDADLTYNPYYEMSWSFHPQWWVGDIFNAALDFSLSRELTEADDTTYDDETLMSDLSLTLAASKFATIPVLDIKMSANVVMIGPTSKASQARTLLFGIRPGLSLSRSFDVLAGINLGYSFGISKFFYESTTGQLNDAPISNCATSPGGCEEYQNTGVRNTSWGLSNSFSLGIAFIDQLSLDASFGIKHSFLYEQSVRASDEIVDPGTGATLTTSESPYSNDDDIRYAMVYGLGLSVIPTQALSIGLGAETANPQLKPDSTYEAPFFNRYTVVYLDLTLDIDGLVQQLTSNEE